MNKLTNLELDSSEKIRDYLVRAEEHQLYVSDVNENVSDQMVCSVVLNGLPQQFSNVVTVSKYSHEPKSFLEVKRDLFNIDSESNLKSTDQGSSSHFSKDVKCFKRGKFGLSKRNVGQKLLRSFLTILVRKITRLMRVPNLKRRRLRSVIKKQKKVFHEMERRQLDNRTQPYRSVFVSCV